MRARVTIRLKPGVLDPQGEAVERGLSSLGLPGAARVRVGKVIEMDLPDGSEATLRKVASEWLANPVIEDATVEVLT
jgi:phosphoribosylformylglycinamidine synthase subunit PurS